MTNEIPSFLDSSAIRILKMQRNEHKALKWQPGKWVMDTSQDSNSIYLWTFSGEKINRSIKTLLSEDLEAKIEYDFKHLTIDFGKGKIDIAKFLELVTTLISKTKDELEYLALKRIKPKWFSKFSECVPDSLGKQTICEKDYDFEGLARELNKNVIKQVNY